MASSEALRVLLFRPTLGPGGADRVTVTLLRHLSRERFRPSLALLRAEGELLPELPPDVPVLSLDADRLCGARAPLARLLRDDPPDVLFSTAGGANPVAVLAARAAGFSGRVVLSERNGLMRDQPWAKRWALLLVKRRLYRHADLVTAVSEGVRGDLLRRLRLPAERVRTVYNPVVTPELERLAAEPLTAEERGDGPLLLAAGRLEPAKAFDVLLQALALVRRDIPVRLVLLGEGSQRPALEAQARRLGVADAVRMPGFVRNPLRWFAACDLFVLSSRFEGLPGVLIQAMACGAAVVATDCPFGPNEIVRPGEDGMLVPVGDAPALAATLRTLLDDEERRRSMAASARLSARRFTLERVLPLYEKALLGAPRDR